MMISNLKLFLNNMRGGEDKFDKEQKTLDVQVRKNTQNAGMYLAYFKNHFKGLNCKFVFQQQENLFFVTFLRVTLNLFDFTDLYMVDSYQGSHRTEGKNRKKKIYILPS